MERTTALRTAILCGNDITGWGPTELGGGEGTVLGMDNKLDIALGRGCITTGWRITAGAVEGNNTKIRGRQRLGKLAWDNCTEWWTVIQSTWGIVHQYVDCSTGQWEGALGMGDCNL